MAEEQDYTKIRPNQEEIDAVLPGPMAGTKLSELPELRQDSVKRQVAARRVREAEQAERDKRRAARQAERQKAREAARSAQSEG